MEWIRINTRLQLGGSAVGWSINRFNFNGFCGCEANKLVGPDEGPGRKTAKAVERPFRRPITQLKLGVNERREAGYSTEKVEEPVCILDVFSGFRPENDH